jgi:hypothetical protein
VGMGDVPARFAGLQAKAGTVAAVVRDECRRAAEAINDAVQGEPTELQAVLQFLEQAAHAGLRGFGELEASEPDEAPQEPANVGGASAGDDTAAAQTKRGRKAKDNDPGADSGE